MPLAWWIARDYGMRAVPDQGPVLAAVVTGGHMLSILWLE